MDTVTYRVTEGVPAPVEKAPPSPAKGSDLKIFIWDLYLGPGPLLDHWTLGFDLLPPPPPRPWSKVTFAGTEKTGQVMWSISPALPCACVCWGVVLSTRSSAL